ncbi:hypothetical protein PORY_002649 [Pneumocystis oryctolagi]|uniref:Uncharacterized protein n=1 Tax=Pneumocystis oryctolagi TaxID=42067 RepID=A0ACB7C8Y4_9ASCO|nr:hypothetical protein PORY_002649 [Pneumocystis oryctolagi]
MSFNMDIDRESSKDENNDNEKISEVYDIENEDSAIDPKTGEINWDCPCLGGMAYGPCGEEFKEAFSCFVYSKEEPKGMECIKKFQTMQDCFKKYPEVYNNEIDNEDNIEINNQNNTEDNVESDKDNIKITKSSN